MHAHSGINHFFYKKECCASSISNYNNDSLKCVQNGDKLKFMKEVEEKRLRETYWRFSNEKWVEVQMAICPIQ